MSAFLIGVAVFCYIALPISMLLYFLEIDKIVKNDRRSLKKAWEWQDDNNKTRNCKQCGTCIWWNVDKNQPSGILLEDSARCMNPRSDDHMQLMLYTDGKECPVYERIEK